ncbi:hypothetical protein LPJ66_010393, partial [Kickxella alabastrina]
MRHSHDAQGSSSSSGGGGVINGLLNLSDSISDSPQFRTTLRSFEDYSSTLESHIQGLSKACKALQQVSQDYSSKWTEVLARINGIAQLSPTGSAPQKSSQSLQTLNEVLAEIERGRAMHVEQLHAAAVRPLEEELSDSSGGLGRVRQGRKRVDVLQAEYESQLGRLMARKPNDPQPQIDAAEAAVESAKGAYIAQVQTLAMDLSRLASVARIDLVEGFLSTVYAQYAGHHQAFAALRGAEPTMQALGTALARERKAAAAEMKEAQAVAAATQQMYASSCSSSTGRGSGSGSGYVRVGQNEEEEGEGQGEGEGEGEGQGQGYSKGQGQGQGDTGGGRPAVVAPRRPLVPSLALAPNEQMAGYLFLRSQYSLLSSWQRRWFSISNGQLTHFQRDTPRDRESIPLHLCLARAGSGAAAALDRRHVFELVAPNRTYILQAESAHDLLAWHSCLRQTIEASLYAHAPAHLAVTRTASQPIGSGGGGGSGSPPIPRGSLPPASEGAPGAAADSRDAQQRRRMAELASVDGNGQCVDCGGPNPEWAATTVGALLCIECSGIHRSLGVHVSKVRSVKLDNWEPELLHIMRRLGNRRVNLIYEARRPSVDDPRRPRAASARGDRQPFIMQKYANRLFVGSALQAGAEPELLEAARSGDLPRALRALAQGASANAFDSATGATPLVEAVGAGDFGMLELLLLWGADPNQRARMTATSYDDSPGRSMGGTPLHWAARLGNVRVVWYLVRR